MVGWLVGGTRVSIIRERCRKSSAVACCDASACQVSQTRFIILSFGFISNLSQLH